MKIKRIVPFLLALLMSLSMASVVFASEIQPTERVRDSYSSNTYLSPEEFPEMVRDLNFDDNYVVLDLNSLPYVVGDGYIEFEIQFDELFAEIVPFRASPLVGNSGVLNAFFPVGQTFAASGIVFFDWRINSIPINAQITNVTLSSQRTVVPNVTYFVGIHRLFSGTWTNGVIGSVDLPWSATARTSDFNGQDPWGEWAIDFFATRIIPPFQQDFGAAATLRSATLRVYFR